MLVFTTTLMAQITTSGISGKVTAEGENVIGATVEAIHTPSGTRYVAVTNDKGMFAINGMRVGGPYEVKIAYIGYEIKVVKDITEKHRHIHQPYLGLNSCLLQLLDNLHNLFHRF